MNELELPQIQDLVAAALLVGALFMVRYVLGVRRILAESASARRLDRQALRRAARPLAYGPEFEPSRRHAMRQFHVGSFFLALGLLLLVWWAVSALA